MDIQGHTEKVAFLIKLGRSARRSVVAAVVATLIVTAAFAQPGEAPSKGAPFVKGRVDRDVQLADEMMLKGRYSEAADFYRQAVSRNPKDVAALLGLGMALARQFKLDGADEQFERAAVLEPNNALVRCGRALVLLNRLQSSSVTVMKNRAAILERAEGELRQAIAQAPALPEAHYVYGLVLREQGKLEEAGKALAEAARLDPRNADALAALGMVKVVEGDLASAQQYFKRAVAINPGNSTAHYGLGRVYLKQGLIDQAIIELNTALYQNPNSSPTHEALGAAYELQGNALAAVKEYQESIRLKPENPQAYARLAEIRKARGDLEHAIAELRSGVELIPENPDLHLMLADLNLRLGKIDDALKEYLIVMRLDPKNAEGCKGITRACYLKAQKETTAAFVASNDFEKAEQLADLAVKIKPDDLELRLALAKIRSLAGKPSELARAGEPATTGERVAYAEALLAQDKFQQAGEQMNKVIAGESDPRQLLAVADLCALIKDLDNAEAAYRKCLTVPEVEERARRGLDQVRRCRDSAAQRLRLARDLASRRQLASAVDNFYAAVGEDPRLAEARLGLARALERLSAGSAQGLREAVKQYRAYLALVADLPGDERERIEQRITTLEKRASRLAQKQARTASGASPER